MGGTTHYVQEWGGDMKFCPGMGEGAGKYHLSLGGQEIYFKDWKMGGGNHTPYPCARISPNFRVLTIQISLFALLVNPLPAAKYGIIRSL